MALTAPASPAAPGLAPPPMGAEAILRVGHLFGRDCLLKARVPKAYRHPELDARLRAERTRDEARLLAAARKAGVRVPVVLDVDAASATIAMERVAGRTLRAQLDADDAATAIARLGALGRAMARLHDAGICHGDGTTSNVLVPEPDPRRADPAEAASLVLLDFGLGAFTDDEEPRGVDLHLVEEALHATREDATALAKAFLDAYAAARPAAGALRRLEEIRERGRYR